MNNLIATGTTNTKICAELIVKPVSTAAQINPEIDSSAFNRSQFFSVQSPTVSNTGTIELVNRDGSKATVTL